MLECLATGFWKLQALYIKVIIYWSGQVIAFFGFVIELPVGLWFHAGVILPFI